MKTFSISWLTLCNGEIIGDGFHPGVEWDGTPKGMNDLREQLIEMCAQGRSGFSICITSFIPCFAD